MANVDKRTMSDGHGNRHCCCCEDYSNSVDIEQTTFDGRMAERHTSFNDDGDKVVEIFAEEKRPLHLEKRIVQKHKNVLAEERVEHVRDGEIVEVEVRSLEPETRLQMREHLGIAEHYATDNKQYVTKQELCPELGPAISEAVVTGIQTMMENIDFSEEDDHAMHMHQPIMSAAAQVQQRVKEGETKSGGTDSVVNMVLAVLIMLQLAFGFWVFFM